jgi:thioredoxin-related protein
MNLAERIGVVIMLWVAVLTAAFFLNSGDGRHDPVKDPVTGIEVDKPTVIMITKEGCAPCEQMKRETLPKAMDNGYTIWTIEQKAERYPTTRIWNGREWRQRVGFFRWGDR